MQLSDWFSQVQYLHARREKGLHPVNEMNRFTILVCGLFCGICVSLPYTFDLYTTQLRDQFELSAGDLSTVSTVGLVFFFFLLPFSVIFEMFGPFANFMICLATGVIGTVGLAQTFSGAIPGNVTTISMFYAFLNLASGLIDTTYISTLFEVFPRNRGPVVCLAKVMTGLGSTIFACLSTTLFKGSLIGFIYFLCAFIAVVTVCASALIVLPLYYMNWWRLRGKSAEEVALLRTTKPLYEYKFVPVRRLIVGYAVVLTLIVFFTVETPVVSYVSRLPRSVELTIGVVVSLRAIALSYEASASERDASAGAAVADAMPTGGNASDPRYPGSTVLDYLKSLDLWLILLYMFCVSPMGIIMSYNGSTISIAKTGNPRSTQTAALYTAFIGLGNSVGRIAFGLFEAYVQHTKGLSGRRRVLVTAALFVSPTLATVGGVLLLVLPGKLILLPYIVVYIMNGFSAALQALIFTCLFESFHNTLYNMAFMVMVICVIVFNRLLFGMYVDMQHRKLRLSASQECNRAVCIETPFIVATCLAAGGLLVAGLAHVRYARFVARVQEWRPGASKPTKCCSPHSRP
ncbi:putative integral membrane protein [Leishmania donovani]|uniref:Putative integral membrane protein n=1 Tax=Leishmania donovani TaxID=5661 RepID=A0A504XW52_LEIDO|nr:putative integral membrane protein [Leishmania donovani]